MLSLLPVRLVRRAAGKEEREGDRLGEGPSTTQSSRHFCLLLCLCCLRISASATAWLFWPTNFQEIKALNFLAAISSALGNSTVAGVPVSLPAPPHLFDF